MFEIFKKINIILVLLILTTLSISAVSGVNINNTKSIDIGASHLEVSDSHSLISHNDSNLSSSLEQSSKSLAKLGIIKNKSIDSKVANLSVYSDKYSDDNLLDSLSVIKHTITESNYDDYFYESGFLKSFVAEGDTLIFKGTFLNKGVITLDRQVNIIGNHGKFTNTTFLVNADGIRIENLTINNYYAATPNCWGIKIITASNISIIRCNISVRDKNTSYGIYIFDSNNNRILNNNIKVRGDRLTYGIVTFECYNNSIGRNNITSIGTKEIYNYEGRQDIDGEHIVVEMFRTYGIVMIYSSNNKIYDNIVKVSSDVKKYVMRYNQSTNTLVGIDLYYDSDNNTVSGNKILVSGKDSFLYGLGVIGAITGETGSSSNNNKFLNNYIRVNGTYYADGIIIGNNVFRTTVKNNTIILHSQNYTYAIILEMSNNAKITHNHIYQYGKSNYGLELFSSSNNVITHNYVYGGGEFSESIGLCGSKNNTVKKNKLISNGTVKHPSKSIVTKNNTKVFGKYSSLFKWYNSLNKKDAKYFKLWLLSKKYKKYSGSGEIKGVSLSKVATWLNSLNSSDKTVVSKWMRNPSSSIIADFPTSHKQNEVHPDAVDLYNINVWIESHSTGNTFDDNEYYSNNPYSIMTDKYSQNNNYGSHNEYSNSNYNGGSNNNGYSSSDSDIILDNPTNINGSSNDGGSSNGNALNGDSDGSVGIDGSSPIGSGSGAAYDINSISKSLNTAAVIPMIILILVALFCYGFLRKDGKEDA